MLGGIPFDVRGLIQVGLESRTGEMYPTRVQDIEIGRLCKKLHFLHSGIDCSAISKGIQIGSYVVHYVNDQQRVIPIIIGQNVADWLDKTNEEDQELVAAWEGTKEVTGKQNLKARLFKETWENPLPEVAIQSIDFLATHQLSAPFLVALTVE